MIAVENNRNNTNFIYSWTFK